MVCTNSKTKSCLLVCHQWQKLDIETFRTAKCSSSLYDPESMMPFHIDDLEKIYCNEIEGIFNHLIPLHSLLTASLWSMVRWWTSDCKTKSASFRTQCSMWTCFCNCFNKFICSSTLKGTENAYDALAQQWEAFWQAKIKKLAVHNNFGNQLTHL